MMHLPCPWSLSLRLRHGDFFPFRRWLAMTCSLSSREQRSMTRTSERKWYKSCPLCWLLGTSVRKILLFMRADVQSIQHRCRTWLSPSQRSAVPGLLGRASRNRSGSLRFRLIMVLCLLVSRLAEVRLQTHLAETEQTLPDQVDKPTARPTMRFRLSMLWGIALLHVQTSTTSLTIVLRLEAVHRLILVLLGPLYEKISHPSG